MAVDGVEDEPRLGCGRLIDRVWERIGLPPDEHELGCPDCRLARANLSELSRLTQSMKVRDLNDPELRPGPGLKSSIMGLARAEVRRGRLLPLRPAPDPSEPPALTISEQAVAGVVRAAADTLDGLHARRCTVRTYEEPIEQAAEPASAPVDVVVELAVAVAAGSEVPQLTMLLRRQVADRVLTTTGLNVRTMNILVEDLFDV